MPQRKRKRQRLGESTVPAERLRAERPNHVWATQKQAIAVCPGVRTLHRYIGPKRRHPPT